MLRTGRGDSLIAPESQRGLVLSARGRQVTVIGPGGRVHRLRLPFTGARPGDEIALLEGLAMPSSAFARGLRLSAAVATGLLLALLIATVSMYFTPLPAVAMVSVDINPGVNVYVNSVLRVVYAQAADEAGELLLDGLTPARQPLGEFLLRLADKASASVAGSDEERWLIIGASPLIQGEVLSERFLARLEEVRATAVGHLAQAAGRETSALPSAVISVPAVVATAARDSGLTPGKYVVLLAALDAGADVRVSDALTSDLLKVITAAGLKPGEILARAAKDDHLEETWRRHEAKANSARTPAASGDPGGTPSGPETPGTGAVPPADQPGSGAKPGVGTAPGQQGSGPTELGTFPVVKGRGANEAKQRAVEVIDRLRQILGDDEMGRATKRAEKKDR